MPTFEEYVNALLASGEIRVEGRDYVGTAIDGVVVSLGTVGEEEALMRYLITHPLPSDW